MTGSRVLDVSALVFQLGAIALVTAMARTSALGPGRGARTGLVVERVLLALASVWTVKLGDVVGGLHLVVGYARLGWLLHRRPELTLG